MHFAIPLICSNRADNWDNVQFLLRRTIRSLINQTSPAWRAIICGQTRPDAVDLDPRVEYLNFNLPHSINDLSDKPPKVRQMIQRLIDEKGEDGYFFMLDADDLLHPELVNYMILRGDQSGYVLTRGYMMNEISRELGYHGFSKSISNSTCPFYLRCGSSAAIRMDTRDDNRFLTVLLNRGRHKTHVHSMAAFGLFLRHVPFASAIYCVNHGENLQLRKGRMEQKLRYIARSRVADDRAKQVLKQFGYGYLGD